MKIPQQLKIGGHIYKIHIVEGDNLKKGYDNWGRTTHHHKEIYLDKTTTLSQREQSFIHETLHCIDWIYNSDGIYKTDKGEEVIARLSEGLYQVLKDNNLLR